MKTGKTLSELATELERQVNLKKDYLADTRSLTMTNTGDSLQLQNNGTVKITNLCHDQISARIGIPKKYYEKMITESPELLATNVNHWFQKNPERRMIRTLDGKARAFLSDRYRPLDNFDLAKAVLPKLIKDTGCSVESAEITETRMYIKAITSRITAEVVPGDMVQAGLVVSNSEVGCGSVKVEPIIFRLVCRNGMIAPDYSLKKYHVGRGQGDMELSTSECFRDETRLADDRAFWMKVSDVVDFTFNKSMFSRIVDSLRKATHQKIEISPIKAIEEVKKRFLFTDNEGDMMLRHLIEGRDLSMYGMSNAVTRTSQDIDDYDRATDLERIGGEIIELSQRDWSLIASNN